MPNKGHKSITIRSDTYEKLEKLYKKERETSESLSGFMIRKLENHIKETQNLQSIAKKITKVPDKFLETKWVIKHD